jgi:hypothetical protein
MNFVALNTLATLRATKSRRVVGGWLGAAQEAQAAGGTDLGEAAAA